MLLTRNSYTRVTLALDIVGVVPGGQYKGFHELGAVKHRIDLCDTISVEEAGADSIACDDPAVPSDGRNICMRAAQLLRERSSISGRVRITIKKKIPVMGGLAGGSANAATTLELLNDLWHLRLSAYELSEIGRNVGMDVPYFFSALTSFDSETGRRLEPISTSCSFDFVLVCPEFGVSTKEAYSDIDYDSIGRRRGMTASMREALEAGDCCRAVSFMHNDFELSIYQKFPSLRAIRKDLLDAGCTGAHLTGSGSTVVGVARDRRHAEEVGKQMACRTLTASTLKRVPA